VAAPAHTVALQLEGVGGDLPAPGVLSRPPKNFESCPAAAPMLQADRRSLPIAAVVEDRSATQIIERLLLAEARGSLAGAAFELCFVGRGRKGLP
jgi:hypothetical protein